MEGVFPLFLPISMLELVVSVIVLVRSTLEASCQGMSYDCKGSRVPMDDDMKKVVFSIQHYEIKDLRGLLQN